MNCHGIARDRIVKRVRAPQRTFFDYSGEMPVPALLLNAGHARGFIVAGAAEIDGLSAGCGYSLLQFLFDIELVVQQDNNCGCERQHSQPCKEEFFGYFRVEFAKPARQHIADELPHEPQTHHH